MKLEEARKLAAHGIGTMSFWAHKNKHFDELVVALSKCLYAMEAIKDDPTIEPFFAEGIAVLARAKEVEI
jgi:hypothetical protein